MGRLAILTILTVLACADVAAARTVGFRHPPSHHMRRTHMRAPRLGRSWRRHTRRLRPVATQARAAVTAAAPRRTLAFNDDAGLDDRPGFFKASHQAGWGFRHGGTTTVVGYYQRPARPDIPAPQIYPNDGRGAAGLSLSLTLGR